MQHPDGRSLDYGALVPDAARQPVPAAGEVTLKQPGQFRVTGAPVKDPFHAQVVTGGLRHGIDLRLPDMLYASIERTLVIGGRVAAMDNSAARQAPGVVDIIPVAGNSFPALDHVRAGVAVLATNSWAAQKGREVLHVTWEEGANATFDSAAWMVELHARAERPGIPCRTEGPGPILPSGAKGLVSRHDFPYLAHAPMEPPNALAWVRDGRAEVWTGTQRQRRLHNALVEVLGLSGDQVLVHAPPLGGGFGRKLEVEYGIEAALLSKAAGRPVQVLWTREDDMTRGLYRPISAHRMVG